MYQLTEKQKILLELLSKGYKYQEIGEMFNVSRQRARKECTQAQRIELKIKGETNVHS